MDSVVILIAAPGSRAIGPAMVSRLRDLTGHPPQWLSKGEVLETFVATATPELRAELGLLVKDHPIDVAIVPAQHRSQRRKRLLIADMDSTMIGQECIDELGALAGVGDRIKAITLSAMRGELDFEQALKARLALMKDLPEAAIGRVLKERITFTPGGRTLIATMRAHGAYAALVSGGFVQFTGHVATELGFDEHRANELLIEDGKLTGGVREPILGKDAKVQALTDLTHRLGLSLEDTIAVGDGANDIPMLQASGLGVALHAKPKVREAAAVSIVHGDLTALLYLQGYWQEEFAS
ncbi:phosphoserine phosphatase SerB [Taklimakanibacter lacteus]|uniref:phosphoserine phosphatase SerB n=1 Tax=Taklimakanibacter lacteus TaxID=2268456 RepID=UPI000E65FF81